DVAEAQDALDAAAVERVEHRAQRLDVAVDVGYDAVECHSRCQRDWNRWRHARANGAGSVQEKRSYTLGACASDHNQPGRPSLPFMLSSRKARQSTRRLSQR